MTNIKITCLLAVTMISSICFCKDNPYDRQIDEQLKLLRSETATVRSGAAEALGFLRANSAADELVLALKDASTSVRRQAAMSLAWCGSRSQIAPLLAALDDKNWTVRQGAWVSLTNLT